MMKKEERIENLKKDSIQVYTGMPVFYRSNEKEIFTLDLEGLVPKFNGCVAVNNSTACYITEQGEIFVAPCTKTLMNELYSLGFMYKYFYVPFSNGDAPLLYEMEYIKLRKQALESYKKEMKADCLRYASKKGIETISPESLKNCLVVPTTGIETDWNGATEMIWPMLNEYCFDSRAVDYMGSYNCNNGRVIFIGCDGHTYLTKGYRIVAELVAAGYVEKPMMVPLSNGETIVDAELKAQWDAIEHIR